MSWTSTRRRLDARGVATVWAVAWIVACSTMGWLGLLGAMIAAAQHHLDGSADLISLSAAARLQRGGDACGTAAELAEDNAVDLESCVVDDADVVVTVSGDLALPFGLDGRMTAVARAGP